jgi:DedD protein
LLPPEFTADPVVAEKEEPTPAAAAPAAAPEVSTPAPTSATAQAGELVIQVFFSSDQEKAQNLVSQLAGGGFPAFLSPVEVGGETMYRVRLGPYDQRSAAEAAAERVRRNYKLDTWITQ